MTKPWKESFYDSYKHGNQNKCLALLQKNMPDTILKFCSGTFNQDGSNDFLNTLKNDEVWLSNPMYFNDPFDCILNIGEENIEKQILSFVVDQKFNEKMCEIYEQDQSLKKISDANNRRIRDEFEKVRKALFVSCFTSGKNINKSLMWSHYANCHKGFCIGYDKEQLLNCDDIFMPVFYKTEVDRPIWLHFLELMSKNEFQLITAYTKSIEWKYEDEWRLLECNESKAGAAGFTKKFIPAKCVYLGCRASSELKKCLIKICTEKGIKLYQMKIKPNSFDLEYELISTK